MNIPTDLKYTKNHEWLKIDGNSVVVGITDYAQHELGDIVFIEIETEGEELEKEAIFGTIEAVKTVSDVFMPLSGTVTEVNGVLEDAPETVNKSPYDEGWLIKIEMSSPEEIEELISADEYKSLTES